MLQGGSAERGGHIVGALLRLVGDAFAARIGGGGAQPSEQEVTIPSFLAAG